MSEGVGGNTNTHKKTREGIVAGEGVGGNTDTHKRRREGIVVG